MVDEDCCGKLPGPIGTLCAGGPVVKARGNAWLRALVRAGKKGRSQAVRTVSALLKSTAPLAKPQARARPKKVTVPLVRKAAKVGPAAPRPALERAPARPGASVTKRAASAPARAKVGRAKPAPRAPARHPARPATTSTAARTAGRDLPSSIPASGKWLASRFLAPPARAGLAARSMSYFLYLPEAVPSQSRPLIVMLHGCEQDATAFAQGTRMNQLAERAGVAVLYPQQSITTHPQRCWKWYDSATQHGAGDARLISAMVEMVAARHAIDPARVYVCGISAGAAMAQIVALRHPNLFAAVGLHSGPVFGAARGAIGALGVMRHGAGVRGDVAMAELLAADPHFPPLPAILIQGEDDPVVRPVNQTQLAHQFMLLNRVSPAALTTTLQRAPTRRTHGYEVRDVRSGRAPLLRVVRIAGLAHAWSGGDARLPFNDGLGPDASKMLLAFFLRHRRL